MKHTPFARRLAWINRSLLIDVACLVVVGFCCILLYRVVQPSFGTASYGVGKTWGTSPLPVQVVLPEVTELKVSFTLEVPVFAPHWYIIRADDCIRSLSVDGHDVSEVLPPCTLPGEPLRLNLGEQLRTGSHTLSFTVQSGGRELIGFDMAPSLLDPLILGVWLLLLAGVFILLHLVSRAYRSTLHTRPTAHPLHRNLPTVVWLLGKFRSPLVLAWVLCAVFFFTYATVQPRIISGYYTDAGKELHLFRGTFSAPRESEDWYNLFFAVRYGWLRPPTLRVMGDDCVQGLVINGLRIPGLQNEACGYDIGARVQITDYVHRGINTMQAVVHNAGGAGALHIKVDQSDPLLTFLLFMAALSGGVGLWMTIRRSRVGADRLLAALIFVGIAARLFYFFATPFFVRANDVDGHIEYAHFLLDHGRLPGMRDTWESFQPPLYYIVSAGIIGVARELRIQGHDEIRVVQSLSPILAIIAFLLCVGMIRRLVDPGKHRMEFMMAVAALAVLPGSIYNAGRVNNDVLVQFFMILGLYELIRCFDPGARRVRHWLIACLSLALGVATKTNALILAPPLILATPFIFWNTGWKKWPLAVLTGLFAVGCYLGVYMMRNPEKDNVIVTNIVTNSVALNGDLIIPNTPRAFLEFSPLQVLLHPFNDGWNDAQRRQYFLEYLYKSAFFGEWGFPEPYLFVGRWLVLAGMFCIPLGLLGIFMAIRRRQPAGYLMLTYGLSVLLLHAVFRYQYPFSPSQDFRYVSSVSVVMAAFTALGVSCLPKTLRPYGAAALALFVAVAVSFLIRLP